MRMIDIIQKKRDNQVLSTEEINFFVSEYTNGNIPDYQISALLMAIYFNKMNEKETADLTMAMVNSGELLDLSEINGIKVDKHSTGGVGDKTTLVLCPLVAACGVPVAKMSGRGLGHTGGTIDKLESFVDFKVQVPKVKFIENVNNIHISIASQTANLTPADKKLYALRDVTGTVENISLIASSIMSKKIASGADKIVLDVKVGSGAFMKDMDDALKLAKEMVTIGQNLNKETVAIITDMEQPLGSAVGNILEVQEAIETLQGNGPKDLEELCIELGAHMLVLGAKAKEIEEGREKIRETIQNGKGLQKLKELINSQGGNSDYVDKPNLFPSANIIENVLSENDGYVSAIEAEIIGKAALVLGAGRETKESSIDLTVGLKLHKKIGDEVKKGDVLATIYANSDERLKEAKSITINAYSFSKEQINKNQIIKQIVKK